MYSSQNVITLRNRILEHITTAIVPRCALIQPERVGCHGAKRVSHSALSAQFSPLPRLRNHVLLIQILPCFSCVRCVQWRALIQIRIAPLCRVMVHVANLIKIQIRKKSETCLPTTTNESIFLFLLLGFWYVIVAIVWRAKMRIGVVRTSRAYMVSSHMCATGKKTAEHKKRSKQAYCSNVRICIARSGYKNVQKQKLVSKRRGFIAKASRLCRVIGYFFPCALGARVQKRGKINWNLRTWCMWMLWYVLMTRYYCGIYILFILSVSGELISKSNTQKIRKSFLRTFSLLFH